MAQFKKILVPTDFSENSEHALVYANALKQAYGSAIDCLHVIDLGHNQIGPVEGVYVSSADVHRSVQMIETHAQKQMEHLVKKERFLGVDMATHQRRGNAPEEIVKAAEEFGSDLLIIATHGRGGFERFLFGSTCDKVVRLSPVPVLSIKPQEREFVKPDGSIELKTILCPMDFSEFSRSALPYATSLAKEFGAKIILSHVVDARLDYPEWTAQASVNNSEHLADEARKNLTELAATMTGVETEVEVVIGISHRALLDTVDRDNVDLVVMPTHGRKGFAHALLGSVAEKVSRLASCPVLTVRPAER